MHYDLAVAWRIYPKVSKTPLIHANSKYELVKTCLYSFLKSTEGLTVKYYVILDGCPETYDVLIKDVLKGKDYSLLKVDKIGNLATFELQVTTLLNQTESDIVYFAEDDYLYKPNEFKKMVRFIKSQKDADFISPYVHTDTFNHPIHDHKKEIKYSIEHLWYTDSSTCMTFLTSKSTLEKTKSLLLTYAKGNNDCSMWLILTKTHIWNPFKYLKYLKDKESFSKLKIAIKYGIRYFFSLKKYKLWIPYPAIGTHLEKEFVICSTEWLQLAKELDTEF